MTTRKDGRDPRGSIQRRGFEKEYWNQVSDSMGLPQQRSPRAFHELNAAFARHLPRGDSRFLEVGCSPGSWMAFFARHFGYQVSGVEYVEEACVRTRQNLRLLEVEGTVHCADFLEWDGGLFDVVFSHGFIEHFSEPGLVMKRIANACGRGGFVVTTIPSLEGLNWWISRTFRPAVARGHFPLSLRSLGEMHEQQGFETLHLGYYGCLQLRSPMESTVFAARYPVFCRWLNAPFACWSKCVSHLTSYLGRYPQLKSLSIGAVYIGRMPSRRPNGS